MSSSAVLESVSTPEPPATRGARGPQRLGIALTVISAAQLMVVLDGTIVNIAMPHIMTDLGFTQENLSWVVTAYTLAFGGLLLLGGRLGDRFGRRRVFLSGVLLFATASLLGGLAQSEGMLLGARALQGVGAALASPSALALITTTFPSGPARNRAMGVYAAMSGAGAAVGLILGGALTEVNWRWTMFINVPIGILVAVLAPRFLNESEPGEGRIDIPGAVLGSLGLASLVYGLTNAASHSWTSTTTVVTLVAGVVLLAAFVAVEARSPHALLPLRILADRTRGTSFTVMLIVGAAMFAMFYFLGLYIQQVLGYSAAEVRLRVPAVQLRHRRRRAGRLGPDVPGRPAVDRRHRHAARGARHVRVLTPRRRQLLRQRAAPLDRHPRLRHGPDLRPDDADGRGRGRARRTRGRLRGAQHHAAGRRRTRPGHSQYGLRQRRQGPRSRARRGAAGQGGLRLPSRRGSSRPRSTTSRSRPRPSARPMPTSWPGS